MNNVNVSSSSSSSKNSTEWSLVPLSKIVNAQSQLSRVLWSTFSVTMMVGLVLSVFLTVHRYIDHATVFRMDYSTANYLNDLPAITICHNAHRVHAAVSHSDLSESTISYDMPEQDTASWSTQTSLSSIYRRLKNFTVDFTTDPPQRLQMSVVEQFPRPKNQMCTDFELSLTHSKVWNKLQIHLYQLSATDSDYYDVVIHNKRTFPLNNYERFLYRRVDPGNFVFLFTAKSLTSHMNTMRNPCDQSFVSLMGRNFTYDQTVCQWRYVCDRLRERCGCDCPLNVLGVVHSPCSARCLVHYSRALVNTSRCPQACSKTKYTELNIVTQPTSDRNKSVLCVVMSTLVSMATEEPIYSMTKMFSEIGGLSSLLFGVSCIIVFEVLEKILQSVRVVHFRSSVPPSDEFSRFESHHRATDVTDDDNDEDEDDDNNEVKANYVNSLSQSPCYRQLRKTVIGSISNNNISTCSQHHFPIEVVIDKLHFSTQLICDSITFPL